MNQQSNDPIPFPAPTTADAAGAAIVAARELRPEHLPTFPAIATAVDGWMRRLPWWAVVAGTVGVVWWVSRRKR